jgi:cyclopropane-fatty-acyl-phospholipid synthase
MLQVLIDLTERGLFPDPLIRVVMRHLLYQRKRSLVALESKKGRYHQEYVKKLKESPLALATDEANRQHYEVPPEFFEKVLGPRRKYSSCFWSDGVTSLAEAETKALEITMDRAGLNQGQRILELGCGWGSLTLSMAEAFPDSSITAVSNSSSQRNFIESELKRRGLKNVTVLTRDLSRAENFDEELGLFDRIVSVEMFEHFLNFEKLLEKVSHWLAPEGRLFVHIFTHDKVPYVFETEGADNWMGRYFFTGGQMPSRGLLRAFDQHLVIEKDWSWEGTHYQKTSEAWLRNQDSHRKEILEILKGVYGEAEAARWFQRWRMFFLAVSELFGYQSGKEWGVSHYRLKKKMSVVSGQHFEGVSS